MKHKNYNQQTLETTEQLKTLTQTTTGKGRNKITGILAVILLFIGITASFSHRFFKSANDNPQLSILASERSALKNKWNNKEVSLDSLFKNNLITKSEYFLIKDKNELQRKLDFRGISKKRKQITNAFSFNGRNSFHYWLWVFGFSLTLFIISCFTAYKDSILYKEGLLKWYEPNASISFISISLFWLYHSIFMKSLDFDNTTYLLVLIGIMFPLGFFIYHFIRRLYTIESKLLENIKSLVSHVLINTKEDKEKEKWNVLEKIADNGK